MTYLETTHYLNELNACFSKKKRTRRYNIDMYIVVSKRKGNIPDKHVKRTSSLENILCPLPTMHHLTNAGMRQPLVQLLTHYVKINYWRMH